jgi:hypothetical protein
MLHKKKDPINLPKKFNKTRKSMKDAGDWTPNTVVALVAKVGQGSGHRNYGFHCQTIDIAMM